jgi:hypothetical protein
MVRKIGRRLRCASLLEIGRRRRQHPIDDADLVRDRVGIGQRTDAHRGIDRVADQILPPVVEQELDA